MLATLHDKAFDNKDWLFEVKWDGYRIITLKNKDSAELVTRNQQNYSSKYPSIQKALLKIKHSAVIDGEVVALNSNGISDFQMLQNYQKTGKANLAYYVFDLLWLEGHNLRNLPLTKRKEILKDIIPETGQIKFSEQIFEKGNELFKAAQKAGLEGIMAKLSESKYYEGIRTKHWLKIKTELRQEAIICGYTAPQGSRKYFGALLLGVYGNGKLIYIGHTGTGFNEISLKQIWDKMKKNVSQNCPFEKIPKSNKPVTWLKPKMICEVKFSNWTSDNLMRHPVFEGLRDDKNAEEIFRERS